MPSLSPDNLIPTSNSTAQEWILWRKSLGEYLGRKQANDYFAKFWGARGGTGAKGNTQELTEYLKTVGLTVDRNAIGQLAGFTNNIGDEIGDIFSVGKWLGISLLVIGVGGLAMIVYGVTKNPTTTVALAKTAI